MNISRTWSLEAIVCLTVIAIAAAATASESETTGWLADSIDTTEFEVDLCSCCDSGCDTCCGDGVDCGSCCCDSDRLFGLIGRSDHCFDGFISPMTNPVFFEDPRTLTEARMIFLQHSVPPAAGGGDVRLIAAQFRAALTDRLSLVAVKDGFIMSTNPLINDGWADVGAGLKYNFYRNVQSQRLMSAGFDYEMPVGTPRALQGSGDGELHFYLSGGAQLGDYSHWISNSGFRLGLDEDADGDLWYWSNHFDYEFRDRWYFLTELNWFNWTRAGSNPALNGVEGGDLFNIGSTGVAGNNIVTNAVGVKFKRDRHHELGVAFEYPLTDRRDVLDNRITVDWIFRY